MPAPSRQPVLSRILADTTVWIRAFRAKTEEERAIRERLQHGLRSRQIYTCWVIKTELVVGAPDEQEYADWLLQLEAVPESN